MSQLDRVEMQFSGGDEAPELEDYRPISLLVIAACIAGLASLLAIFHPLLWIVPVVAVILSVCAIRQVSMPQSRYSGRLAAVAALFLALLIGTYAPARAISRERELYRRAVTQAKEWISLVQQGRHQEAHQFTLEIRNRFQGPGPLSEHYRPPVKTAQSNVNSMDPATMNPADMMMERSAHDELATFLQWPVVKKLAEFGKQGSVTLVQNVSIRNAYGGNLKVTQRFRVSGMRDGQTESIELLLSSTRSEALGYANWQFGGLRAVE